MEEVGHPRCILRFGAFEADLQSGELRKSGLRIRLPDQSFQILAMLLNRPGDVVTREQLRLTLWPNGTFVDFDHSLNTAIKRLRDALGDSAESPRFVETLARRGYRFVAPVEAVTPGTSLSGREWAKGTGEGAHLDAGAVHDIETLSRRGYRFVGAVRRFPRTALGIAAVTLLASLVAAGLFYKFAARSKTIGSVAVLPFVNASGDPNAEYLSDGITESLINSLSQLTQLKVMSRDATFRYKGKETDAQTIGRELRVQAVFKGRVTQRGDNLEISAELVDARDDSHIWGEQYSRKASDIFALQGEITREMTGALRVRLTGEDEKRLTKSFTANPEAYQDYMKGRYWWNKRTREGLNKGIEYFQQAIAKDPTYALAYSGLADCYILLPVYGLLPPNEAYPRAREAALKALEIDDTLAEAHTSLARVKAEYDWDWSGGERDFQRAIEFNPSYATAHQWYGDVLETMGRPEKAVAEYKRALELDPLSLIMNRGLGQALIYVRQYDQAIEPLQKTLELDPYFPGTHRFLGRAYLQKSMYKEGIAEMEKEMVVSPGFPWNLSMLGYAYAVAGRRAEAQKVLDKLNELSKQEYLPAGCTARIYSGLGEKDKAFKWLEKAYEERSIGLGGMAIKVDPLWDPLRSDPRFADLLRRMNLQP